MIFYVIAITFYATLFASFLLMGTLLAIWFGIGRTHIAIRVPAFLLGSAALGLVLVFDQELIIYLTGLVCIAFSLVRSTRTLQIMSFLFGSALLLGLLYHVDATQLDSAWILRITMATSLIAAMISTLRLFGFKLINLTEGISRLEIEQGTGRDLDQWIVELDAINGASLKHADIMAHLRQYGFSFDWQRTLTYAYEKTLGRWAVAQATTGRRHLVVSESTGPAGDLAVPQPQFSIRQILLLTFGAACFLGFARKVGWYVPSGLDLRYGMPGTLGLGVITAVLLWARLAVRETRQRLLVAVTTALVTFAAVVHFIPGNGIVFFWYWPVVAAYAVTLILVLNVVRQHGYRLVRVHAARPLNQR